MTSRSTGLQVIKGNNDDVQTDTSSLEFPEVFSGVAGDFAELYSSYLEAPKQFFFMGFLTCLGTALADKLTLESEIAPQPRLYVVLLGESADDRKSTALKKVIDFFDDAGVDSFQVSWGVGSAEGLQTLLEENNRLLLCFDEFKQFVSKCRITSSVLLPCVNTLFESNQYENRTKKLKINLRNSHLSILGASTTQTYERTWDANFIDIGFTNRLFLVPGSGQRKYSFPAKVPEKEKLSLAERLGEVIGSVGKYQELGITPAALEVYDKWYFSQERSVHTKRLDTYAMRLMALLAVNDFKAEVDEETVHKAIALSDWQLEVRRQHDPIDAENTTAKMEEKIRRVLANGPKTDRVLKQRTNANRVGLWFFDTAKKNLQRYDEITLKGKDKRWHLKE
jgi:hypothetical protein